MRLLWEVHFADVPRGFPIVPRFGSRARNRFGSIAARDGQSVILINQLFADPAVPAFVVDGTLVHELAHYAHGFGSGLPRLHAHAHRGGVVEKELAKRGLGELDTKAAQWRKAHWDAFYEMRCTDIVARRTAKTDRTATLWQAFLEQPEKRTEEELRGRLRLIAGKFGFAEEEALPFGVEWLRATRRQEGLSYWYAQSRAVRLHGLLADRRVPGIALDFEIGYWLARCLAGESWQRVQKALRQVGMDTVAEEALRWRRSSWAAFCNRHHPLPAPAAQARAKRRLTGR